MEPFQLGLQHPLTLAIAFLPMCLNIGLLVFALRRLPRDRISSLFALWLSCLILWQLYDCFVRTSITMETALFWRRLFFPFQMLAFPTGLHFALLYAGRDRLAERPAVLAALYLPAMFLTNVHREWLYDDAYWGWIQLPDPSVRAMVEVVYGTSSSVLMLFILGLAVRRWSRDPGHRTQALIIFAGMLVPVGLGLVFEVGFPQVLQIHQWPITSTTLSAFSIATVIALTRFRLFDMSSGTAVEAVLETMQDALVVATPEHHLLYANRAAAEMFGIDRSQVRAFGVERLFPDAAAWDAFRGRVIEPTIAGEPSAAHDTVLRTVTGALVPALVSSAAVPVSRGGRPGVLLLAHDVSELKRVQSELAQAKQAAEEANVAKSSFLANMSHELRTPLNAILGYTDLVKELLTDDGYTEVTPDLDKVSGAAQHLLALINDVLDLSKIEAGRMDVVPEEFELAELIAEVRPLANVLAEKRNNGFLLRCPPDLGRVRLDRVKVKQILLNLLSNACKFTESGQVTLAVSLVDGERVSLAVIDTGLGMSPEQLSKLFQRFSQVHTDREKYGGTGLGLVLCMRFAELMDGDVTVSSEAGKGSTFLLNLPRRLPVSAP